jgi:UDP-glucose 4-epimerase
MVEGEPPIIDGDGDQERDFVYVGDVVRAHLLALEDLTTGVYNLGTGQATSVNDLYALLQRLTGSQHVADHGPPRPGDIRRMVLDPSRAAADLGWRPEVPLEEGLRRTLEWYQAQEEA